MLLRNQQGGHFYWDTVYIIYYDLQIKWKHLLKHVTVIVTILLALNDDWECKLNEMLERRCDTVSQQVTDSDK